MYSADVRSSVLALSLQMHLCWCTLLPKADVASPAMASVASPGFAAPSLILSVLPISVSEIRFTYSLNPGSAMFSLHPALFAPRFPAGCSLVILWQKLILTPHWLTASYVTAKILSLWTKYLFMVFPILCRLNAVLPFWSTPHHCTCPDILILT